MRCCRRTNNPNYIRVIPGLTHRGKQSHAQKNTHYYTITLLLTLRYRLQASLHSFVQSLSNTQDLSLHTQEHCQIQTHTDTAEAIPSNQSIYQLVNQRNDSLTTISIIDQPFTSFIKQKHFLGPASYFLLYSVSYN